MPVSVGHLADVHPRLIVPYTEIAPGVREGLAATGWSWEEAFVGGSDSAYFELLADLWSAREAFIIVEHDVILRPDSLDQLWNCSCAWGGYAVPYVGSHYHGMACVKFTEELIARIPDALVQVAGMDGDDHPAKHWCRLDARLQAHVLPRSGLQRHPHDPPLGHFRPDGASPWPSHGCIQPWQ